MDDSISGCWMQLGNNIDGLRKVISTTSQIDFYAKIDDHGIRRGDKGRILAQWQNPVASRVALDLPYWAMRSASYRPICMAIKN
jgi:predicted GNAT superfamily acetyltransferase